MRLRSALAAVFFLLFTSAVTWAQVISTAQIRGTVRDASGADIAGAQIKLTQTSTGAVRTTTSAADGTYSFPDLPIGPYRLEVTRTGFTKYVQTGIVLQVGANPTINVTLKVGAVTQEVQVNAQAVMVQTQSEGVGEVTPPLEVQNLPLNGRQVTDLLPLAGAVGQGRAFRASYPSSAVISIAGGAQGSVAYWLDGGTHNDPLSNQNLPLPFPDTIEEFKVETSSLPAQYGTHPSGSVNVVTKSGTNSFHGDAFEYVRNYIFDSKNTSFAAAAQINPVTGKTFGFRPPLKRNQFGGTLGGPIKRDKLFFFLGWQDTIQRSTNPAQTTLPTAAMEAGDFQPCLGTAPVLNAPYGTGGYGPNQIDPANFSPVIRALLDHIPVAPAAGPTGVGSPYQCGTYNYQTPANFTENQGLVRIDYHQSNKNTIFGRYFITNWEQPPGIPEKLPNGNPDLLIAAIDGASNRVQNLTLGDTYLLTSTMVNNFRVTGNRSRNLTVQNNTITLSDLFSEAQASYGLDPALIGNIYQLGPNISPFFKNYMSGFGVAPGFFGLFNSTPSLQPYDTMEFSDDLAFTRGSHQFDFGVDFINLRAFAHNYLFNQGNFTFDGNRTNLTPFPLASSGLSDFLIGYTSATNGFAQDAPIPSLQHQNVFALYAQDAWKVNRHLTVTLGLRWDPFFGHTVPGGVTAVNVSLDNILTCSQGAGAGCVHSTKFPAAPVGYLFPGDPGGPNGNKLTPNALDKWSPRIGLAWDPMGNGRMSIRAGFGIFYDFPNFSYDQFGFEEPWGGAVTAPGGNCTTTCITDPWGTTASAPNSFSFIDQQGVTHTGPNANPFPTYVGQGPAKSAYIPGSLVFSYPTNYIKPTYVMQYNLSIEKQVGTNWLLSITYLGSQQRHLWGNNEANPGLQGPCPGTYPAGFPLPPGVTCTAAGGGGTTVAGPCPPDAPPFACPGIFGAVFGPAAATAGALNNNRLFYHANIDPLNPGVANPTYLGSLCAAANSPNASCYGETLLLEEGGTGNYNGLLLSAQHQFGHHFTSTTNYTWSHCISDNYTTTLGFFLAAESVPYLRKADRGNCPNADTHNIFNESLVAESPDFSGHMTEMLLGHWGFSVSAIVQSGTDFSPINILDFSGSGNALTQRPDLIPGTNPYCQPKGRTCWLKPVGQSIVPPAPYTYGNLKNMSLFGPGSIIVNTGLWRDFNITERQKVTFKWEVFNLPNHANLYPPQGGLVAPTFGQPTQASTAGLGALNQTTNDPRTMQFSLKYSF